MNFFDLNQPFPGNVEVVLRILLIALVLISMFFVPNKIVKLRMKDRFRIIIGKFPNEREFFGEEYQKLYVTKIIARIFIVVLVVKFTITVLKILFLNR